MKADSSIVLLLMQIFRYHIHYNFAKLEHIDMHPRQFPMLRILFEYPGLNQREIAEKLNIKPPTVAVSIKRMEKAGLVERKQDQNNQRISRIYITDAGTQVMNLGRKIIAVEEEMLLQDFTEEEKAQVRQYLQRMRNNLRLLKTSNTEQ
ncbi:MarR family winged helix-turn-helix transcriptional regulator [Desulfitobacterium sp. AusDCA]|uniref:MarR family winged helix-turn-helix transcriptional regulator n=1 Tax=Desulfitobacterium sp. AusDCA TaxID=3240383 RepID=UPI003DA7273B